MELARLKADAKELLTEEFLRGDTPQLKVDSSQYVEPIEQVVHLTAFTTCVDQAIAETKANSPNVDSWLAPRLHKSLPLRRREAADAGVWRYVAVVVRPQFVRHRWGGSPSMLFSHFWNVSARPRREDNAFARLWWIAELTRDESGYARTEAALQSRFNMLFKSQLGHYGPAVRACIDELQHIPQSQCDQIIKDVNRELTLTPLEGLDETGIRQLTRLAVERMMGGSGR